MSTPTGFEFDLPLAGNDSHYVVSPIHSADGHLRKLTIWQNRPEAEMVADIDIDPGLFTQFAMPNMETVCRIAIAQAAVEGAFAQAGANLGLTLDFAIEPWEGALAPA